MKSIPEALIPVDLPSKKIYGWKIVNDIGSIMVGFAKGLRRIMVGLEHAIQIPLGYMGIRHERHDHMVRVQAFDNLGRPLRIFNGILEVRKGVVVVIDIPFVPDPPSQDCGVILKCVDNGGNVVGPGDLTVKGESTGIMTLIPYL